MTEVPHFFAGPLRKVVDITPGDTHVIPSDGERSKQRSYAYLIFLAALFGGGSIFIAAWLAGLMTADQAAHAIRNLTPANDN